MRKVPNMAWVAGVELLAMSVFFIHAFGWIGAVVALMNVQIVIGGLVMRRAR